MTEPRIGQRPWWADETLTKKAHDQGYAEGSAHSIGLLRQMADEAETQARTLIAIGLYVTTTELQGAVVALRLAANRIEAGDHAAHAAEVRLWASELDQRGML